uniref:Umc1463 n=1 Tax=Arundo donax TaxID=35708 RepID=A0A0A9I9I8_ARUDO
MCYPKRKRSNKTSNHSYNSPTDCGHQIMRRSNLSYTTDTNRAVS